MVLKTTAEDVRSKLQNQDVLFSPEEAAIFLSVKRRVVYNLLQEGELAYLKIGRLYRIPRSSIDSYVVSQRQAAVDEVEYNRQLLVEREAARNAKTMIG